MFRPGGRGGLAEAGTLGASQAGLLASWRLGGGAPSSLFLTGRLSAPLGSRGAEAAVGLEWRPSRRVPVRIVGERRQRIAGEGRSAFALLAHGGVSDRPLAGGLVLDAYAQAGVVGLRSRDLFADGGATLTRPLGPVALGAGLWGGVQPGLARLDAGPAASAKLRAGPVAVRVAAEYRFRIAGEAAPGSGPVLTIGTSF